MARLAAGWACGPISGAQRADEHTPADQDKLGDEISTIVLNRPRVPPSRDQHDVIPVERAFSLACDF
jgi:hypothetical protein